MALLDKNDAIDRLEPHFDAIYAIHMDAWNDWEEIPLKQRVKIHIRTRAGMLHDFAVAAATRRLHAKLFDLAGLSLFVFEPDICLRLKMFDGELRSRNQQTDQVEKFQAQEQMEGVQAKHNLEAGYVLDQLGQNIDSVHLTCPNGRYKNYWDIEISNAGHVTNVSDMFDPSNSEKSTEQREEKSKWRRRESGVVVPIKRDEPSV